MIPPEVAIGSILFMRLFASGELSREAGKLIEKIPDDVSSPKELKKYLRVIDGVKFSEINIGPYKGKCIKYKEKSKSRVTEKISKMLKNAKCFMQR